MTRGQFLQQAGEGSVTVKQQPAASRALMWWTIGPAERCPQRGPAIYGKRYKRRERLFQYPNVTPYVKDAFHRYVISGEKDAVNPAAVGTMAAAQYLL